MREALEGEAEDFFYLIFVPHFLSHLEGEAEDWAKGRRGKRSPSGSDYCQVVFHRTCDQVFKQDLINIDVFVFI